MLTVLYTNEKSSHFYLLYLDLANDSLQNRGIVYEPRIESYISSWTRQMIAFKIEVEYKTGHYTKTRKVDTITTLYSMRSCIRYGC
jgi:hypothetical protein